MSLGKPNREPITSAGDTNFRLKALPQVATACILYLGDEEVQTSMNFLFDAAAIA